MTIPCTYLCHKSVDPTLRNCGSFVRVRHSFMCVGAAAAYRELMLAASLWCYCCPPPQSCCSVENCAAPQSCIPNLFSLQLLLLVWEMETSNPWISLSPIRIVDKYTSLNFPEWKSHNWPEVCWFVSRTRTTWDNSFTCWTPRLERTKPSLGEPSSYKPSWQPSSSVWSLERHQNRNQWSQSIGSRVVES